MHVTVGDTPPVRTSDAPKYWSFDEPLNPNVYRAVPVELSGSVIVPRADGESLEFNCPAIVMTALVGDPVAVQRTVQPWGAGPTTCIAGGKETFAVAPCIMFSVDEKAAVVPTHNSAKSSITFFISISYFLVRNSKSSRHHPPAVLCWWVGISAWQL